MIIGAHAPLLCPCDTADQVPSRVGCPNLLYGQPNVRNFVQTSKQASTAALLCCISINFIFFGDDKC